MRQTRPAASSPRSRRSGGLGGLFAAAAFSTLALSATAWGQNVSATWGANANTAWYTGGNWVGGLYAGVQGVAASNTNIATFTSAFTGTAPGINMNMANLNLGAISADSTRSTALNIGNSSSAASGVLRLYGASVNSVSNVIVRNNGTGLITLQATQAGTMGVVLGNTTDNIVNIDNTGGVTISAIISSLAAGNKLTKGGSGAGVLTLSGANTLNGDLTVSTGTLKLDASGTIASVPNIVLATGTTFDVSTETTALALGAGQTLKATATGANTTATLTTLTGKGLTLSAGGLVFTAYGGGATAPLTVNGAGNLAMNSAPVTVTTTTPLTAGTYTLIAAGTGSVTGTPGTVVVNGSGLAASTTAAVAVTSGQLILTVTSTAATFTSAQSGDWNTGSTWVGGVVPSAGATVNIVSPHNVTVAANLTTTGAVTVASGASFGVGPNTYTNNGTININGTFKILPSGFANGSGPWTYGASSTLEFATTSNFGFATTHVFWPTTNGPPNVNVSGSGGITMTSANRTVSGTFQTAGPITLTTTTLTLTGTAQINTGGSFTSGSSPVYGAASLLKYNILNANFSRGAEWTAGTGSTIGTTAGYPNNVQVSNGSTLDFPNGSATTRACAGSLTIDAGSNLYQDFSNNSAALVVGTDAIINGNLSFGFSSGGDFTLGGNWTRAASGSALNTNNRAVFFNGSGTQTITRTGGETFTFLRTTGSGTVKLASSLTVTGNPTPITLTSGSTTNTIDLNGQTLTVSGGGTLGLNAGTRAITSSVSGGVFAVTTTGLAVSTGAGNVLTFGDNVTVQLAAGMDFGSGVTTIGGGTSGTLQINAGGFVNTNPPKYAAGSLLQYNSGTNPYARNTEWSATSGTAGTTAGYPQNVQVSNNTTLNYPNGGVGTLFTGGNLTIDSGSSLFMDYNSPATSAALTVAGNVVLSGNLSLGNNAGGDLNLGGNWSRTGILTTNNRSVRFNGAAAQTITGTTAFAFLTINNTSGGVSLSSPISVSATLTLTSGIVTTTSTNSLTIGSAGSISGGSPTSFINGPLDWTLLGNQSGAGSFSFPIGAGATYMPGTISSVTTGASGPVIRLQATLANAGGAPDGTSVTALDTTEFWTKTVVSGNFTSGSISLTRSAALGTLNILAASTSQGGSYSSIGGIANTPTINGGLIGSAASQFVVMASGIVNFYSKSTGNLDVLSNWGLNTDGTGSAPSNFSSANQVFNIRNRTAATIGAAWTVSGASSKVIVGDPAFVPVTFTVPSAFAFNGTIDIPAASSGSNTLTLQNTAIPTFGTLNAGSTVDYDGSGSQTIAAANYGNLTSTNSGARTLASSGTVGIAGAFTPGTNTYTLTGSTVTFNSAGAQTIPAFNYNNLSTANSGARTLASSGIIGVAGTFTTTNSTYTTTGSTVDYNGTGGNITTFAYNNLSVSGSGTYIFTASYTGSGSIAGNYSQAGTATVQAANSASARTITINGSFSLSNGIFQLINASTNVNTTVNVGGSVTISGTGKLNLESVSSTTGVATLNITGDFVCTATSTAAAGANGVVDFGTGTITGNAINIGGNFSKTGVGTFGTSSSSPSSGFVFNGAGTQTFSDDGAGASLYTQYLVNSGSRLQMLTGLTLGTGTNPTSTFTVNGTLDMGTQVISSTDTNATFSLNAGASLKTAKSTGIGGSITLTGTKTFSSAANYTYNGSVNQAVGTVTYTPTPNTVANLTIANTGTAPNNVVSLGTPLTATGALTLTSGLLATTTANTLTLTNTATTAVVGGSTSSFVNGPLNWTLPANLSASASVYGFPVGSGTTYLPASLTTLTTGVSGPVLQVQASASNAGGTPDGSTVTSLSTSEFWSNKVVSGNFTNGVLSLTRQTAVAPNTLIAKSTASNGTYSSIGGTASGNSINTSSPVGAITAGNSQFYVLGFNSTITITGSLTPFTTTYGTASATQTLSVSGSQLTNDITATAPAGYEVSNGGAFGASTTFTQSGGSASGTLSIRIAAATKPSDSLGTTLAFTSSGATTQNVTTSGTVNKFTPAVTVAGTTSFTYTRAPQGPNTSTVNGVGGGATPTGTVTYSYVGVLGTTYSASATQPTNAGDYTVTASYPGDANYNVASSSATAFNIARKGLTITPDSGQKKVKGAGDPTLTFASVGLISPDTVGGSLSRDSGETVSANYNITQGTVDNTNNPNYDITFTTGVKFLIYGPFAAADSGITKPSNGSSIKIPLATLISNDYRLDSSGAQQTDSLSITAVANGATCSVSISGAFVLFTPDGTSSIDTFTYTLTDGTNSATDTGTVTVTTSASGPFTLQIVSKGTATFDGTNTMITVNFVSVPNQSVFMEYATSMSGPWTARGTVSTGTSGSFAVTFTQSGDQTTAWNTAMFFRATH